MAVTVANLITNFDTYIGDSSTDRISTAERYQFLTEATVWLQEEIGNDHMVKTYVLPYYDNVHYYKVTSAIASLLEGADLRRAEADQYQTMAHKSGRELAEEVGQKFPESSWAIERHDSDSYLVVNHMSKYPAQLIASFDSITADGGTWAADTTNSDATNVTVDVYEYKQGSASLNFDITVAQSGNNRATIVNSSISTLDLTQYNNLATWVFWVYIPDVTYTTSVTLFWGSSSTAYWSASATADVNGNAFVAGWNRIAIAWNGATMTLTPTVSAITYIRYDVNYGASQANATDYRIDDLTLVRAENLTFFYTSWYVGTASGSPLTAFSATTDVPFFSGQYDQYKYAVAHYAASRAMYGPLRLANQGQLEEVEAIKALNRVKKLIPSSITKEMKSFKVRGINFNKSSGLSRHFIFSQ